MEENVTIRSYLSREASRITALALRDYRDPDSFHRLQPEKRRQFLEMMGISGALMDKRPRVPVHVTGTVQRAGYRVEKLSYESLPNLHVTANLYLPTNDHPNNIYPTNNHPANSLPTNNISTDSVPANEGLSCLPGVLYVCGHGQNQKVFYQAHARRFAQLGMVCLIAETVQLGEVAGHHHGCCRLGWYHWYSRGYSPAAIELYNGIRGLDLLAQRAEVDGERLGVTGISGGGAVTWWIAAGDERVKAAAPVCGTTTLESHVYDRMVDGHCDCMWWPNSKQWDMADVGGLIAPRPLLIASADRDGLFPIASIRKVHNQLERLYGMLGKEDLLKLVETPGGHSYHETSRTAIFSWFLKHLADKETSPDVVGDIDTPEDQPETLETLRVFACGSRLTDSKMAASPPTGFPAVNRTTTIHDEFIEIAAPKVIRDAAELELERERVVALLREHTFAAFPKVPPPLKLVEEFSLDAGTGTRFAFTSEEGWRLHGWKLTPPDPAEPLPALVTMRMPGEERGAAERLAGQVRGTWARIIVEPRGTGETGWGDDQNWHLRRAAAWTGRTLASMQVWDVLRALEAARKLHGVNSERVALVANGQMAAIALYAALLDGRVKTLFLDSPPATQNAGGRPDGRGPAIEMLNCLRFTDLPQVAGLLHPTELVVAGEFPESFAWAEALHKRLGSAVRRIQDLGSWKPA